MIDDDLASPESKPKKKCCNIYDGNLDAIGYSWISVGRGMMIMSNLFIAQSLLFLAADAAGCNIEGETNNAETCKKKIYGFVPSSLITNIAVIGGIASAFMMPICGALVDFTPYRRLVGISVAIGLTLIQAVQIYTVETTWFAMAMLQAVSAVFYQLQLVTLNAYLIDVAQDVGESRMNRFSTNFISILYASHLVFIFIVVAIQIAFGTSVVLTAQISQGLNTLSTSLFFGVGWFVYMTPRSAVRLLPEGRSLITEGFRQNWNTLKSIHTQYRHGLRWFFLALVFAEACATAITVVSIVYLTDTLKLDPTQTSIFFFISLVGTLPGCQLGWWVTRKTNPNTSYKMSMGYLYVVLVVGALVLEEVPAHYSYVWAFLVGAGVGWFYTTEYLFFSTSLPRGQEAELSGFFIFCTQILVWLPPLVFTLLNEINVRQKYGVVATSSFFLVAIGLLMLTSSWDEIVEEAKSGVAKAADIDNDTKRKPDGGDDDVNDCRNEQDVDGG